MYKLKELEMIARGNPGYKSQNEIKFITTTKEYDWEFSHVTDVFKETGQVLFEKSLNYLLKRGAHRLAMYKLLREIPFMSFYSTAQYALKLSKTSTFLDEGNFINSLFYRSHPLLDIVPLAYGINKETGKKLAKAGFSIKRLSQKAVLNKGLRQFWIHVNNSLMHEEDKKQLKKKSYYLFMSNKIDLEGFLSGAIKVVIDNPKLEGLSYKDVLLLILGHNNFTIVNPEVFLKNVKHMKRAHPFNWNDIFLIYQKTGFENNNDITRELLLLTSLSSSKMKPTVARAFIARVRYFGHVLSDYDRYSFLRNNKNIIKKMITILRNLIKVLENSKMSADGQIIFLTNFFEYATKWLIHEADNERFGYKELPENYLSFEEFLNLKANLIRDPNKLLETQNQKLEKIALRIKSKSFSVPEIQVERRNFIAKFLSSTRDIAIEGNKMSHCVAGYSDLALRGETFIFSIKKKGNFSRSDRFNSTVEYRYVNGKWKITQHYAAFNSKPDKTAIKIADDVLKSLNEEYPFGFEVPIMQEAS